MSRRDVPLAVIAVALAVWAARFVANTTFFHDGVEYYCLFDDAMISMTYARNLLEGHGLNWARFGAPVEGYTHPLWVLLMIPINLVPIALRLKSVLVQAAGLLFLVGNLLVLRSLVIKHFELGRTWIAVVAATAFYTPLGYWSLLGLEASLQALLVTGAIHLALDVTESREPRQVALFSVCAAALLLRMDMAIPCAVILAYVAWRGGFAPPHRRRVLLGVAIFAGANLAYLIFRWRYFGDLLPNTYYLKLGGIPIADRLERGFQCLIRSLKPMAPLCAVALLAAPILAVRRPKLILPAAIPLLCMGYSLWVGGDAWELRIVANRFVCFAMPLLFIVLGHLLERFLERISAGRALSGALQIAFALLLFVAFNDLWERNGERWRVFIGQERAVDVELTHRRAREMMSLKRVLAPSGRIAVTWAGVAGYFTDFELCDHLGYNDRRIARMPPRATDDWTKWIPGHVKSDVNYVMGTLRPDILVQTNAHPDYWAQFGYVKRDGLVVRKDSVKLLR